MIIALDGPAGSGKSSVAKEVASKLGFHYLDTGAMYRACAAYALDEGFLIEDEAQIKPLAEQCKIDFGYVGDSPIPTTVFIDGRDVTQKIRTPEVDGAVSPISKHRSVREAMVAKQREISGQGNYVVEGRDIGTVVFPGAELKVFMTASPEERARRRSQQNTEQGLPSDYDAILQSIIERDKADSERAISPLKPAEDAIMLDTSDLTQEEVVDHILGLAIERGLKEN